MLAKKLQGAAKAVEPVFIESVFSTWLYTGNGSTQTITNGIDLAGKGGLVWLKKRNAAAVHHVYDTARGAGYRIYPNLTNAQLYDPFYSLTAFNNNGFSIGDESDINASGSTFASWTFRKQPKFFDVVTYTGNGVAGRQIAHSLGSVPGCIIVKRTDAAYGWGVYHRGANASNPENYLLFLNQTAAASSNTAWNNTPPSSTTFTVGSGDVNNVNGATYVACLFAHNAGGFGLTGTDNVISCGSYTGNGSATGPVVTLGYEPQWLLIKNASDISNWTLVDNMRGMSVQSLASTSLLYANLSNAEAVDRAAIPLATGFQINDNGSAVNTSGATYIYIAIRRGPMKTPTSGASVFAVQANNGATNGTATANMFTSWFPIDMYLMGYRNGSSSNALVVTRLTSIGDRTLVTSSTMAENSGSSPRLDDMDGVYQTNTLSANLGLCGWMFRRAPGFFDVVCYTGTGSARTVAHNLGVPPELIIAKVRDLAGEQWAVQAYPALAADKVGFLNSTNKFDTLSQFNSTAPTSTVFSVNSSINEAGYKNVAYLFASCPGVSKVGSYTGNGSTQTINCGFTGGARFVLIKSTSTTGNWYVWDSARGIVAGNDPYLLFNSTAAEVTTTDWVDTASSGFELSNAAGNLANSNGVSYIFLAIA